MTYFTPTVRYIFIYSFRMSCIPKQIQLLESHDGLSRLRPAHPCQQPTCRSSVSPARPSRKLQSTTVWLMWHSWQVQLNICLIHISFAVLHLSTKKISIGFYFIHGTLETWTYQSCSLLLRPQVVLSELLAEP